MQYAEMIDLIEEAKYAGSARTGAVNELLSEQFDLWLDESVIGGATEEEYERLKLAFEEGYGICTHEQK